MTARDAVINRMEDPVKLTDTQLLLLSRASQRDDRALEPPSNLTGGAAAKVVVELLTEGLVEEIRARDSFPVWRRDDEDGPRSGKAQPAEIAGVLTRREVTSQRPALAG
jgi:hypothetical protein